jgi:hypothetical protein
MIFRWSLWGIQKAKNVELLQYSILSFKHHFGANHEYVVFTDDPRAIKETIGNIANIYFFSEGGINVYNIESKATWKKWCPKVRLDIHEIEIYIDSDVFLLKYPFEIENLISNHKVKFAILDEFLGQPWQHGAMKQKATSNTPFINAGMFIQKVGCDISTDLECELNWWKENILPSEQTHHDEQGALAIALTPYYVAGELSILPKDKYMLIGPNENTDIENIESITLFHAVYPEHPAFYKFKFHLNKILNI